MSKKMKSAGKAPKASNKAAGSFTKAPRPAKKGK